MPQLDASTYLPQLVWLAIAFTALYILMARIGLPAVGAALELRRKKIGGDLDAAERMKVEAESVIAAYERALADARAAGQEIVRQATEKLNAEAIERRRQIVQEIQSETAAAEKRIDAVRAQALSELRIVATDVARAAAQRVASIEVSAAEAGAAVDAVMSERV